MADGGPRSKAKARRRSRSTPAQPPSTWRHRVCRTAAARRRSMRSGSRADLRRRAGHAIGVQAVDAAVAARATATLEPSDITAVRVCRASIPSLPATGALEVGAEHDGWFGAGWHLGERGGTQRFRWSQRDVDVAVANGEACADQDDASPAGRRTRTARRFRRRSMARRCPRARCRPARGPIAGSICRNSDRSGINSCR